MSLRTARFEMRMTPELRDVLDRARGDVERTAYVERALVQRLQREGFIDSRGAPADDVEPVPTTSLGSSSASTQPEQPEQSPTEGGTPERTFPRRPLPRATGGRKGRS